MEQSQLWSNLPLNLQEYEAEPGTEWILQSVSVKNADERLAGSGLVTSVVIGMVQTHEKVRDNLGL